MQKFRARDLGIPFDGTPGPNNSITDVVGVLVGHTTLVEGGTGMFRHDFKSGIGTSSRMLTEKAGGYTVGVLVQSNYGDRDELLITGISVGRAIPELMPELREASGDLLQFTPEEGAQF